jgi:O-antigen/teichoic acid export membrane protein
MSPLLKKFAARVYGSAVAWTLLFAVVRGVGNLLVLPLMLKKLPQEHLGLWYLFLSLAGLCGLLDMGFYASLSRATAYLWAGAQKLDKFGVTPIEQSSDAGIAPNYRLLAELVKTMRFYYVGLALLVTTLMGALGTMWILHKTEHLTSIHTVMWAWGLFLLGILINTISYMWHPLLSGINQVRLNQQILLWSLICNYTVTVIGLIGGLGLFAPVTGYLIMGLVARTAAQIKFAHFSKAKLYARAAKWSAELLRTLWPIAWRTGVVSLGIYATLNASTLVCAAFLGLRVTASFGLSSQLAIAAMWLASAFTTVKLPIIAQMQARGKNRDIPGIIFPRVRYYWFVYITLSLAAISLGPVILHNVLHSKTPLLASGPLIALFIFVGLEGHHAIFREIALTANQNPFAKPVIISGLLIVLLSIILVRWIGLWGLILAPGIVQLCFNNWWTVLVGLRSMGSSAGDYFKGLFGQKSGIPS